MKFSFETNYNQKTLSMMAYALRKTVRKKRSKRSTIVGALVTAAGLWLVFGGGFVPDFQSIVTLSVVVLMVIVLLWQDPINGYIARKRMMKGMDKAVTEFYEDNYHTITSLGKTEWGYDVMSGLAETRDYFVFLFDQSHAQIYDKQKLSGGTVEEFRSFIEEKSGKKMERLKK